MASWNRRLRRATGTAAAVYVLALLLLLGFQRSLLFPAPPPREVRAAGGTVLRLRGRGGVPAVALHVPAPEGARTVAWFHGNGEQLADVAPLAAELRAQGFGVFAVEYPGYGLAAAGEATEPNLYAAADAALAHLHGPLGVAPERVVLVGQSLGSGVATEMATRGHGARLALVSPFTSMPDMAAHLFPWLPARWLVRDRFDTASKAPSLRLPVLIVHGDADALVPVAMGRTLGTLFPTARVEIVPRGQHNDLFAAHGARVLDALVRFAR